MRPKHTNIMLLTMLYVAGLGATQTNSASPDIHPITPEKIIPRSDEARSKLSSPGLTGIHHTIGQNRHRTLKRPSRHRLPFHWENDISGEQTYIVQFEDAPIALYTGDIPGFSATSPRFSAPAFGSGRRYGKLDSTKDQIAAYQGYLTTQQNRVLSTIRSIVPQAEVTDRYSIALNGASVLMTQQQASSVAKLPGVIAVTRSINHQLLTDAGPKHIGADKLWTGSAASVKLPINGEGIVVGIIDTGINTDHPSFAAVSGDGYIHKNPKGAGNYVGDCVESPTLCNDKLIGVRSYTTITDTYKDPVYQPDVPQWELDYKRQPNGEDYNGHGSHTASTTAGNLLKKIPYKIPQPTEVGDGFDTPLVFPEVSGVAPRANIIAYQTCYPGDGSYKESFGGCPTNVLVQAIEDAIKDGVDIINFSIGASEKQPWYDPIEMAFLAAREAGISVAASAGNSANQARDHVSPWLTSVAASTHSRMIDPKKGNIAVSGDGPNLEGQGVTGSFTGSLVNAADYGDELCLEPFETGTFNSQDIVICLRGEIARVTKGANVAAGGAGAVVLYNAVPYDDGSGGNSLNLNPFPIPGLHIDATSGQSLVQWVKDNPQSQATITPSVIRSTEREADVLADFSSRGPSQTNPNVMFPNVSAPGVDIFAAWADEMPFTKNPAPADYAAISGTSMSGPHVAGAMALLTQAHPEWTPAMIQSALMTTALPGKVKNPNGEGLIKAHFYEMGSGVINIARAVDAGLVQDETSENYRGANPDQGGDVTSLNLPFLANEKCVHRCSWMRTFTATQDSDWQLETAVFNADGAPVMALDVSPKHFSIKKGQTQSVLVTAKMLDVDTVGSPSQEAFGRLLLTPSNKDLPDQYLPLMARSAKEKLPSSIQGQIHRDTGTMLTPELNTKAISSLSVKVNGLVQGTTQTHKLSSAHTKGIDFTKPETLNNNPGVYTHFFDVKAGTRRIVWELIGSDKAAVNRLDIGLDLNKDGAVQWLDEAICFSNTGHHDYCTINDPSPGRYWVMASNLKWVFTEDGDKDTIDNISTSIAIIGNGDNSNLTINGPQSTDGKVPYKLELNWSLDNPQKGDRFYGLVEIGNSPENIGNIGRMGVSLIHQGDDVTIVPSKPQAGEGDTVEFTVTLKPNLLALERDVEFKITVPNELQLSEDSIKTVSSGKLVKEGLSVKDQVITVATNQVSSDAVKRSYRFTTSDDDTGCRIPLGGNPYYLDLKKEANINPIESIKGTVQDISYFNLSSTGIETIPLYNNQADFMEADSLGISPGGFIQFDGFWLKHPFHYRMDLQFTPQALVGPLWRGDGVITPGYDEDEQEYAGVSLAASNDSRYLIVEWDNMGQGETFGFGSPDPAARYSFEVLASSQLNFNPGEHEFIFAYNKIKGQSSEIGSIGTHGYYGPTDLFGPVLGYIGDSFAFDDLDRKVKEGLVVCANYEGPEQSEIQISFAARVGAKAVGQNIEVEASSNYTGSDSVVTKASVKVPSNLTIGSLSDMSVDENSSISFDVIVRDKENTANSIKVEGKNIAASVKDNKVTITPDAHWFGKTSVKVTAYDKVFPNDAASTSFMLNVISDGKPKPNPQPKPKPKPAPDKGGSLGWIWIAAFACLVGRRYRRSA